MRKFQNFHAQLASGFTLVELMVVVLVVSILTAIAVPSYSTYVRKSRRTEVKSMLLDLASREERYMATNGAYSSAVTDLGLTGTWPVYTASGYYGIATPVITAAAASTSTTAATPAAFTITATASGTQAKDTNCLAFQLTSSGQQTSYNSTTPSTAALTTGCW